MFARFPGNRATLAKSPGNRHAGNAGGLGDIPHGDLTWIAAVFRQIQIPRISHPY